MESNTTIGWKQTNDTTTVQNIVTTPWQDSNPRKHWNTRQE